MSEEQGGTFNPNWKDANTQCPKCRRYIEKEYYAENGCVDCDQPPMPCVYAGDKDAEICSKCDGVDRICSHQSTPSVNSTK